MRDRTRRAEHAQRLGRGARWEPRSCPAAADPVPHRRRRAPARHRSASCARAAWRPTARWWRSRPRAGSSRLHRRRGRASAQPPRLAPSAHATRLRRRRARGSRTSSSSPNHPSHSSSGLQAAVVVERRTEGVDQAGDGVRLACSLPVADRLLRQVVGDAPGHRAAVELRPPGPARSARARRGAAGRRGGGSDTTRPSGREARRSRWCSRASRSICADPVVSSTASQRPPDMRSRTDVYVRNCASSGGSRDRSSRRKYSDTKRSLPSSPRPTPAAALPACSDSAARYRPAGQPSVRSVSSESWVGSSSTPTASSSNPASCSSSRRSDTPISCTHPCDRQRASGSAGSSRLVIAICEPAGTYRTSSARTSRQDRLSTRCRSSSTSTIGCSSRRHRGPDAPDARRPGERCWAGQHFQHLGRDRPDTEQRRRDVPQEHPGVVVVPPVERHPRERTRIALGPPREKGRLAVPGRRDDGRADVRSAARSRAITSTFATVPGRVDGAASLTSTRSKGTSRDSHPVQMLGQRATARRATDLRLEKSGHFMPSV